MLTGLDPPTGLPLPFMSAGSTSIMIFMAMLGAKAKCAQAECEEIINKR